MPSNPHSRSDSPHRDLRIAQLRQKLPDGPIRQQQNTQLASRSRVMEPRAYPPCTRVHHRLFPQQCQAAPLPELMIRTERAERIRASSKPDPKADPAFVSTHPCKEPPSASISDRREPHGQSHADGTKLAIPCLRLDQHDIGRKSEW